MVAQLLEQEAGIVLMSQFCVTVRRFALDDHECGINPFLPLEPVLLGLGSQVIDVIERDLVEIANSRVKVAGDGDIQNQRQPIPPRSLNTDILLKRDDWLGSGRGADDQVGLDQGLAKPLEWHGLAVPAGCDRESSVRIAVGDQDFAWVQSFQMPQGELAHLAGTNHQHGLVGEGVKDFLGKIDGDAGNR